jgi:hypothetical protein
VTGAEAAALGLSPQEEAALGRVEQEHQGSYAAASQEYEELGMMLRKRLADKPASRHNAEGLLSRMQELLAQMERARVKRYIDSGMVLSARKVAALRRMRLKQRRGVSLPAQEACPSPERSAYFLDGGVTLPHDRYCLRKGEVSRFSPDRPVLRSLRDFRLRRERGRQEYGQLVRQLTKELARAAVRRDAVDGLLQQLEQARKTIIINKLDSYFYMDANLYTPEGEAVLLNVKPRKPRKIRDKGPLIEWL